MLDDTRPWLDAGASDRLSHLINELSRELKRALQIRLMEHNVSHGFWPYLRVLWERDEVTQRELSELVGLTEPTTHSALVAMEKLGYVERYRLPDNMRKTYVQLTEKGRALKDALVPIADELNAVAVKGVSAADVEVVRRVVVLMKRNLQKHEVEMQLSMPPLRKMTIT